MAFSEKKTFIIVTSRFSTLLCLRSVSGSLYCSKLIGPEFTVATSRFSEQVHGKEGYLIFSTELIV